MNGEPLYWLIQRPRPVFLAGSSASSSRRLSASWKNQGGRRFGDGANGAKVGGRFISRSRCRRNRPSRSGPSRVIAGVPVHRSPTAPKLERTPVWCPGVYVLIASCTRQRSLNDALYPAGVGPGRSFLSGRSVDGGKVKKVV